MPKSKSVKRYEIVNKSASAIVINSIKAVLRPPGQVCGKVYITEDDLDNQEIVYLGGRGLISVVEVDEPQQKVASKKRAEVIRADEIIEKTPNLIPEQDEDRMGSTVVVMQGKIPVRKNMLHDATQVSPTPPPIVPEDDGYTAKIIDPDAPAN